MIENIAKRLISFVSAKLNGPVIFLACEIIEHLWNEQEILSNMLRYCRCADIVHISTPKYTYGFNLGKDWDQSRQEIDHLRTYTPSEFTTLIQNMFGNTYQANFYNSAVMHMRLLKKESPFELDANPNIDKEMEEIVKFEKLIMEEKI